MQQDQLERDEPHGSQLGCPLCTDRTLVICLVKCRQISVKHQRTGCWQLGGYLQPRVERAGAAGGGGDQSRRVAAPPHRWQHVCLPCPPRPLRPAGHSRARPLHQAPRTNVSGPRLACCAVQALVQAGVPGRGKDGAPLAGPHQPSGGGGQAGAHRWQGRLATHTT